MELARAAGLVESSDRPLEVRVTPRRPGRTARARPLMTHPLVLALPLRSSQNEFPLKEAVRPVSHPASEEPDFGGDSSDVDFDALLPAETQPRTAMPRSWLFCCSSFSLSCYSS